jgi:hypothetical protein
MHQTAPALTLRGIVQLVDIERIAFAALTEANRPAGENPIVIALELGFRMLPYMEGTAPEWGKTTSTTICFEAPGNEDLHADRVRLAIARGLLLRSGLPHTPADMGQLARRLRQRPD